MEAIGALFNTIFLIPISNLLIFFYKLLEGAGVPGALGFAIILLTVVIRLIIWPLTHSQIKSTSKMAAMKPLLDELKTKYTDKMELQKAQMALYKEHGVNPAGGCLPTLIQLPILIALYQAIINVFPESGEKAAVGLGWINSILYSDWLRLENVPDPHFFGLDLSAKPSEFMTGGIILLSVPLLTAFLTFLQSKMMIPAKPLKVYPTDSAKEVKEKENVEDMMSSMQSQMLYLMPVMIGFFAFQFPVGLAIYWNMLTIIGIFQQYLISGWGGLGPLLNRIGLNVSEKHLPDTVVLREQNSHRPASRQVVKSKFGTKVTVERIKKVS